MKKLASILRLDFVPSSADCALLALRLWFGLPLLLLHGVDKLSKYQEMSRGFPDPLQIGHRNSLILALIGEVLCPILMIVGFFTRFGALGSAINMSVAFFLVHKHALKGAHSGEMAFLYLGGFVALLLAGGGRFSLDAKSGKSSAPRKPKPAND
jgi:putative oxidoreductase